MASPTTHMQELESSTFFNTVIPIAISVIFINITLLFITLVFGFELFQITTSIISEHKNPIILSYLGIITFTIIYKVRKARKGIATQLPKDVFKVLSKNDFRFYLDVKLISKNLMNKHSESVKNFEKNDYAILFTKK